MKKLNRFWKVMLIVLALTTTGVFGILSWHLYQKLYGHSNYTENYSRGLEKIFYRNGTVRVINTQTLRYTTPKLDWIANYDQDDSLTVFCYKCKRGYMSLYDGKIAIPAHYQSAWMFSEGLGAVIKDNQLGFINYAGKEVIPFKFPINPVPATKIDFVFKKGFCTMVNSKGKHGLINKKGEWVIQPEYDYIRNPEHGYRVVLKNKKAGLLDSLLRVALPFEYDAITIAEDGLIVARDGMQKKLSFDGRTVITPFVYDKANNIYYNSGKVNKKGEDIQIISDYLVFNINNKMGLLDKNGKVVIKARFDDISALANDLFSCKLGDFNIMLNAKGEVTK